MRSVVLSVQLVLYALVSIPSAAQAGTLIPQENRGHYKTNHREKLKSDHRKTSQILHLTSLSSLPKPMVPTFGGVVS